MVTRNLTQIEREEIYNGLLTEAPYISGDEEKSIKPKQIEWLNPDLIKEGQLFVKNNFFAIMLAHLAALLYGFSFRRLSTVLLRTGKSTEINDSIKRYLSTFRHFKTWYETDIVNEYYSNNNINNDKGHQDIQRVRAIHVWALKKSQIIPLPNENELEPTKYKYELIHAIKEDLKIIETVQLPLELHTYTPQILMSQFDMVMTQFGLVSLIYLFPNTLGIKNTKGIHGFIHLWAVFGRLLGIEDRFNIALYPNKELYHKIFLNVGIGSLKECDLSVVTLQKSFIDGINQYTHFGSIKSFLYHGLRSKEALPAFQGKNLYKIMNWWDLFYYISLRFILFCYSDFTFFRDFVNYTARLLIEITFKKYLSGNDVVRIKK